MAKGCIWKLSWNHQITASQDASKARWSEFDLAAATWRIPPERMKKREAHVFPLPAQAVEALLALQGITGRHAHVFPGRDDRKNRWRWHPSGKC